MLLHVHLLHHFFGGQSQSLDTIVSMNVNESVYESDVTKGQ